MKYIYFVLSAMALLTLTAYGIRKQERAECVQWQHDESRLPDWYATQWQIDQCRQYSIEL